MQRHLRSRCLAQLRPDLFLRLRVVVFEFELARDLDLVALQHCSPNRREQLHLLHRSKDLRDCPDRLAAPIAAIGSQQ